MTDSSSTDSPPHPNASSDLLPPCRHLRTTIGDPTLVKHMLDEQAAMYLLDQGYVEDVTLSNVKIGLSIASCTLTLLAQLIPMQWPELGPTQMPNFLKTCVGVYFFMQGIYQLLYLTAEKDCILQTKSRASNAPTTSSNNSGKKKKNVNAADDTSSAKGVPLLNLPSVAVSLAASLERYDTAYQLTLSTRASESLLGGLKKSSDHKQKLVSVKRTLDITHYFDVNGVMLLDKYQADVRRLIEEFIQAMKQQGSKKRE